MVSLRFRLGNAFLHMNFILMPTLAAPISVGTPFMDQNVKKIRSIDGVVEKVRCFIKLLGRNKATMMY